MKKREFKAESKRLLELMIHSIYTNKEIFLRELISNASDATDKRYFKQLEKGGEALNRSELPITITLDKEAGTITVSDHGIGMTEEELVENLGTIAQSGSLEFKNQLEEQDEIDIIGQFGVGFYSAYMVADKIQVDSRPLDGAAHRWLSEGIEGYTIEAVEKEEVGTTLTITLKKDTEEDKYSRFLEPYYVEELVKKHSDYIRYPIQMEKEHTRPIETEDKDEKTETEDKDEKTETEYETYKELETLNTMTPLWKRQKSEVKPEEYNQFYKEKFREYSDPLKAITTSGEGAVSYHALLFIPSQVPPNFYNKDFKKGLQLYANGVLIMEHAPELLPEHFSFVRGIVDSPDLSLNISREMLQQNRQVEVIAKRLEKRIQSELETMLKNSRQDYNQFFKNFGLSIKFSLYESFGQNKDQLQDLLLFQSSTGDLVTFKEYFDRMPEDQKYIYYATGDNLAQLKNLPAAEAVQAKNYEILYLTEQVDEFTLRQLREYEGKEFRSITGDDLGLETEAEKEEKEKQTEDSKELLDFLTETLKGKVAKVRLSSRLKSHAVYLTTEGDITLEMEKAFAQMPNGPEIKAERVLELNSDHPVFSKMNQLLKDNKPLLETYADVLYNQSLLLEGLPLEDPAAYTKAVTELLI